MQDNNVGKRKKTSILLVKNINDDEKELSRIVSPLYDVVCSRPDVEEVLSLIRDDSKSIFAVIVDAHDALPILRKVRAVPALEKLPFLITIDSSGSEMDSEILALDVIDFIKRPFNEQRILNRIKTAVRLYEADKIIDELERDELTGLYTRSAFLRKAERVRRENPNKKFCILGFDFENFKTTNSTYGEQKCDDFLVYTAKSLKKLLPNGIAGRFGGDQYILFFDYQDSIDVERIKKISKTILDSAPVPHQVLKTGIYAPIDMDLQMVECCDRAFLAVREIKGKYGRDIAFYENRFIEQLLAGQQIVDLMERALEEGQFHVYYQPKHETVTCKIAGAEALVRWIHPEHGLMLPGLFIPIFEHNGFITKLDVFILEQVCKDIKSWKEQNLPIVPVSVNISRLDFLEQGCLERLVGIIDSYKIPHNLLHLEVTESLYSDNTEIIASQVKRAQELGFMIEMDDFGAGYSCLGMLSSFSLDVLKLDISFVKHIKQNEIVIENVIKMAHRMGLLTVAEGAETTEQFKMLKSLGCDFIQGFYFSEPLPLSEYEAYMKNKAVMTEKHKVSTKRTSKEVSLLSETMLLAANEVAEGLPGGFFSYHADGNLELISFNKELINMFGCDTAEEFREYTGNSFRGIVFEEDFQRIQDSITVQITPENDIDTVEYRIRSKDGSIKFVRDYGRFVSTEKYGDIFYVFIYDITEEENRKILEEEERLKKLDLERTVEITQAANNAKSIFMYNIAEEVIQPIKHIINCTANMLKNVTNQDIVKDNLMKSRKHEEYLINYVNNMLEYARLEQGEIKVIERAIDTTEAVKKIYELIEDKVKEKGIEVEYWSDIKHPYIYQDINHTTSVVMNIVSNAVKYTPPGGKIKFGLRQTPGDNPNYCLIHFICEDTGIGISSEFLPNVYKSFVREDNEVNQKNPSAGLGLNIAKSLLQLMHGTIEITSEQGKGTTVHSFQPHRYAQKEDVEKGTFLIENVNE